LNPPTSLHRIKTSLLDLLFPLRCLGCGTEGSLLCPSCCQSLPRIKHPLCQRCGSPLNEWNLCPACISHPLTIDGIRSLFLFGGTVRHAIHQLKYRHLKAMAAPLGHLLVEFLRTYPLPGEVLIPVPLHPRRLRERGYNQAALLAGIVGKATGLPVAEGLLFRQRDTITQARTASAVERRSNVRDAFICRRELDGERILLIDDVCTTGATLDACAAALKAAGAGSVWGLTIAREVSLIIQK
jgi:ComF family protein